MTLEELAKKNNYSIRHVTQPLSKEESFDKCLTPFEFAELYGGTVDGFQYYNNFYLYPLDK